MKGKVKGKIIALASLALASLMAFTTAVTAAAFFNYELHQQEIIVNLSYAKYFGGGDGTQANPYQISTSEHLRNLSKLVNIGVFGPEDHFVVSDFTYKGEALTPIGCEQFPFKSHFYGTPGGSYGEIVPVISNLVIEGNNLSDIGMFGVIGPTADVNNFVLASPTINVNGTDPFNADKLDKNPLRNIVKTFESTDYIFSKANVQQEIILTNTNPVADTNDSSKTAGCLGFSISKGNLPNEYPISSKAMAPLTYYCDYNHSELITGTGDIQTGAVNFTVSNNAANPDTSEKPKTGSYIVVEVGVRGVVNTPDGARFAQMTLERFKLYYDYNKHFIIANPEEPSMYRKVINPGAVSSKYDEQNMLVEDFSKGIYVGVLCGTLYGNAKRIGVSGATLNIKRPFISNSIIVGKALDDDERKNLTKEEFSAPAILEGKNKLTYNYTPAQLVNYPGVSNTDQGKGNRMVMDLYGPKGMSEQSKNTIRIYGKRRASNAPKDEGAVKKDEGVVLTKNKVYTGIADKVDPNEPNVSDGVYITEKNRANMQASDYMQATLPSISFKDVMFNTLTDWERPRNLLQNSGYRNMMINNSIMLWVSGADGKGLITRWLSSGIDFYLDLELDYALYTEDYAEVKNGTKSKSNVELQIEGARKSIKPVVIDTIFSGSYKFWFDETENAIKAPDGSDTLDVVRANGESKTNLNYLYGRYQDPDNEAANAKRLTEFNANEINGSLQDADDPNFVSKIQTRRIKIKSETARLFQGSNKNIQDLYPLFMVGLKDTQPLSDPNDETSPRVKTKFRFDIYGIRVIISDLKGNVDSSIGEIDFVDTSNELPITSNGWNGSNIKVGAKTLLNSKVVPNADASTANFIAPHSEANGITNYNIKTSKSGKNVTITWNPMGSSLKEFTYIHPHGPVKYSNLVVTKA